MRKVLAIIVIIINSCYLIAVTVTYALYCLREL